MSTGLECFFTEVAPGEWYYVLERWDSPKGALDWRDYADAYGPFKTEDQASQHLRDNHANPGGSTVEPWHEGKTTDATMDLLIKECKQRGNFGVGRA